MANKERDDLLAEVLSRMGDPAFRNLLCAVAPDGSHPLIPAFKSDTLHGVLSDVQASGGAGNVVVPLANGFMIIAMSTSSRSVGETATHPPLDVNCTIGVLLARLVQDGREDGEARTYCLVGTGAEAARADLAGIAA